MDVIGGFDVSTHDEDKNIIDTQYFANVNDAGNLAIAVGNKIFDNQDKSAFGDKVDKPAEPSQENIDKTLCDVPMLNDMHNNTGQTNFFFKDELSSTNAETTSSGKNFSYTETAVFRGAFSTFRFLAQTLYHELIHIQDAQSGFLNNNVMHYTGQYGIRAAKEIASQIGEIRAYRIGQENTGSSLEDNGYQNALKYLKDKNVNYKF